MDPNLLDYIKVLTQADRKNLVGKTLKGMEEYGELAKTILPYESEGATTHRFVTKDQILDNIADNMLVLVSILYDEKVDMTYEELEQKMLEKCGKWAELQGRDMRTHGKKTPYEIHVTVPNSADIDVFREACAELNVKPIFLDLELNDRNVLKDYMTSSGFMGDNGGAIREVERISNGLRARGFTVVREKVETVPWHPSAPSDTDLNPTMPPNCYFESHYGIKCPPEQRELLESALQSLETQHGYHLHLSKNIFKRSADGIPVVMSTFRSYGGTSETFKGSVERIENWLRSRMWDVDKVIVEFSVYDTKVSHDKAWIENGLQATK